MAPLVYTGRADEITPYPWMDHDLMIGKARIVFVIIAAALSGCEAHTPVSDGIDDPFERENRGVHAFNKGFDEVVFKAPPGQPRSVDNAFVGAVSNVGSNLRLPGKIANSILQARPEPAVKNTFRFLVNTTIGVGGIFDPAGQALGLTEEDTDFGETLAVWGIREGPYIELPFYGPSNVRDAFGRGGDILINPVSVILSGADAIAASLTSLSGKAADRKINGDIVESILYDSVDSYAQTRLIYLQNRRYHLAGQESRDEDAWDPYADE